MYTYIHAHTHTHRLDVGTGGAMIIAKTRACADHFRKLINVYVCMNAGMFT